MEENKKISSAVIRRLPRYYRYLGELIESGVQRISSKDLSVRMKVTGLTRRVDSLGRIVIPKELRRMLHIKEGSPLEIYMN